MCINVCYQKNLEKELRECVESLQRLISSDNPLSGFGQWMTDLVQTLHQDNSLSTTIIIYNNIVLNDKINICSLGFIKTK